MSANMRCDLWKLNAINAIILLHCMLKIFLPVHGHHRLTILVKAKKSGITINHGLHLKLRSHLDNILKAFIHIILHRNHSGTGVDFCCINVNQRPGLLKLMIDIDGSIFHVQILQCQTCKLRNTHPRCDMLPPLKSYRF